MPRPTIELNGYVHGQNLYNKFRQTNDSSLQLAFHKYETFRNAIEDLAIDNSSTIVEYVNIFNIYRSETLNTFETRSNSGQENLRSSMMEEFFVHLFYPMVQKKLGSIPSNFFMGKGKGYIDLNVFT